MQVTDIQRKLKKVLNINLSIDGDYGKSTTAAVVKFQQLYGLAVDGKVGPTTQTKLEEAYSAMTKENSKLLNFGKRRFVVFVDAGHWGIDDNGNYAKTGKYYKHEGAEMHEHGYFYEGYENRLAAEAFIEALTQKGIMAVRTYHPFRETSLADRADIVKGYLRRGYVGYLHSFHSNAIGTENTKDKLDRTTGFQTYTTLGSTFSDKIAQEHFNIVRRSLGDNWNVRQQLQDGDADHEANFQILRETDLEEFTNFGSILEEWGFYTSEQDTKFIINETTRQVRVSCALALALWVQRELLNAR